MFAGDSQSGIAAIQARRAVSKLFAAAAARTN